MGKFVACFQFNDKTAHPASKGFCIIFIFQLYPLTDKVMVGLFMFKVLSLPYLSTELKVFPMSTIHLAKNGLRLYIIYCTAFIFYV